MSLLARLARRLVARATELLLLLVALSLLLFGLLQLAGDPALALAGADADPETVAAVRSAWRLDRPLPEQALRFVERTLTLDFGTAIGSGQNALAAVGDALPATLGLAVLAILLSIIVGVPLGAWIGQAPERGPQRLVMEGVVLIQGTPGFVVALLLIQLFAVGLNLVPAIGQSGPSSWILPVVSVALFLCPKLIRMVAGNVAAARSADWVRTARAGGAGEADVLLRHILPNALIGAIALVGAQFAFLAGGLLVIETLFAWPGLGRLLLQATLTLDYPIIQAATVVITLLVAAVNALTDALVAIVDPRVRRPAAA
ncbi:ABC transporter permease [Thermaurantiacus tibetensis]|uniref:ABC transporter permease n=1 Tax=Thermaurantiacus tibetensis TaxID=2759035 RepID=UPI0018902090|nr:ABC transporter permease [Thermaurantiacus tibetensis]